MDESVSQRYSRQILFNGIGHEGQQKLLRSQVLIVGCGALGTAQAEALARAGVGKLKIVDRDYVEASNLQRQTMFTELDARERLPKAIAAQRHLSEINSSIQVESIVADVNNSNIERLVQGCDVVVDGTDNFVTRFLINDACVKHKVSWIYGGAVGSAGVSMTIRPHQSACLRCIFPELPPPASAPTCDTAGVIMPIINVVAAIQVSETLKLLTGHFTDLHQKLIHIDVWQNEWRTIQPGSPSSDCQTCAKGIYQTLEATNSEGAAVLCGRDAIQIMPAKPVQLDFKKLAETLALTGEVVFNQYLLRFRTGDIEITVFNDARSIIRGTDDVTAARSIYARYIGN